MRAHEFITEGEMHDWHQRCIPGMKSLTGVGQYYELYRFGIAMAQAGRDNDPMLGSPDGVTEDNPTTLSYTQADEDIINKALSRTGYASKNITTMASEEPTDTHRVSPVANLGPVKRKS